MTLFRSARTAAQHLYARYAPDADRTHSPRDKAVAASATDLEVCPLRQLL